MKNNFTAKIPTTKRRIISTFFLGILIIVGSRVFTLIINFIYLHFLLNSLSSADLQVFLSNPPIYHRVFNLSILFVGVIAYVLVGYFFGKRLKQKSYLYAVYFVLLMFVLGLCISLLVFLLPNELLYGVKFSDEFAKMARERVLTEIVSKAPISILEKLVLTVFGTWLTKRSIFPSANV